MTKSINQFLVEANGGCWHEGYPRCEKCGRAYGICDEINPDFSKWKNFGELWKIAQAKGIGIELDMDVGRVIVSDRKTALPKFCNVDTENTPRITSELTAKALGWEVEK